jgi:hypothetical protein
MATSPLQAGFADSEMPDDGMTADDNPAGSVELCIQIAPDGGMTVYKEMPGQDGAQQESERQQVADIGQALAAVLKLYKAMGAANQDATSQLQAGFGGAQQQPQRGGMMR